jgi:hypothetical protein
MQKGLREHAGPGHWNDPDMLEVGNGMAVHEDRAHFSMWSMLAAPLIAGNDLRNMSTATREILTNREVIGMTGFGASAPAKQLFPHFGFTRDRVTAAVEGLLSRR